MVLGYSMLPCGMGIMFRSPGMAVPVTAIVLLVNIIMVKTKEEPDFEERFGEEYRAYRRRTPFLIPRIGSLIKAVNALIGSDDEKTGRPHRLMERYPDVRAREPLKPKTPRDISKVSIMA
jgi:hypothetical protein